jgi:mono/diheme cytochrome c family protein
MRRPFILLAGFVLTVVTPIAALSAPAGTTTAQGVYTASQADAGAQLYATRCAMCHGRDLLGTHETPPLKGRFLGNWGHAPLGRLFDYVSRAMPQFAPGSLTPDQNAAVVAYMLRENGMPVGATPLGNQAAALDPIAIEPAR